MKLFFKQVGMAAHSFKDHFIFYCFINEKPVRLNVTRFSARIITNELMVFVNFIQGFAA